MSRQKRNQMFGYAYRAYTRTSAAMRRSKRLMQIQMTNIGTDKARIGQSYLSIHISTIHIYLCATCMNDVTDFYDLCFKDTVRGRVGDHQCSQILLVFFSFGAKILHVYIPLPVASTGDGHESCLNSRCRICAVS